MFEYFTPITGLLGGSLIGSSAVILLLVNGDILGASGILSSIFTEPQNLGDTKQFWKLLLLSTFLMTSSFVLGPDYIDDPRTVNDDSVPKPSTLAYAIAGLLVGIGTRLGNGCTSGHGVCGLGRRSMRSFVAVISFMATAVLVATLTSPDTSFAQYTESLRATPTFTIDTALGAGVSFTVFGMMIASFIIHRATFQKEDKSKFVGATVSGVLFASGLAISQMVLGSKLFGFLNAASISSGTWDPTLATVLGAAVPLSMISYEFVQGFAICQKSCSMSSPLCAPEFCVPTKTKIDMELILGAAIFGLGWGLGLLCPGPAIFHVAVGNTDVVYVWLPTFLVGSIIGKKLKASERHNYTAVSS